jgi:hypothetical protein
MATPDNPVIAGVSRRTFIKKASGTVLLFGLGVSTYAANSQRCSGVVSGRPTTWECVLTPKPGGCAGIHAGECVIVEGGSYGDTVNCIGALGGAGEGGAGGNKICVW